jgi:hypothetical protein
MRAPQEPTSNVPENSTSNVPENSTFIRILKILKANWVNVPVAIAIALWSVWTYHWTTAKTQAEQALAQSLQNRQTSAKLVEASTNIAKAGVIVNEGVLVLANNKAGSNKVQIAKFGIHEATNDLKDVEKNLKK